MIESAKIILIEQKLRFKIQGEYGVLMGLVSRCAKYQWETEIKVKSDNTYQLKIITLESEKNKANEMISKINEISSGIIYLE